MSTFRNKDHETFLTQFIDDVPDTVVAVAQRRVWDRIVQDTKRYWWQRSISLPLPVAAAASILFLVMTIGLIINPGVLSNDPPTAGLIAGTNPVNVQVQVNGAESDLLLKWLEEQNQVGNVTIQLPDHAEFQIRGEPVLLKPENDLLRHDDSEQFEIVPMEAPGE